MPHTYPVQRAWSSDSTTSDLSTTYTHSSRNSSHTQYTETTAYSDTKPTTKHLETYESSPHHLVEPSSHHYNSLDPRSSAETYASTIAEEDDVCWKVGGLYPPLRRPTRHLEAVATTPGEFAKLFPSTRRLLIQHDGTTEDGNFNLRVDTEISLAKDHRIKMTLFHLRMFDLAERQFALRRYQRQSGREVCSSKRKYLKPTPRPSMAPRKLSLTEVLTKISFKGLGGKYLTRSNTGADLSEPEDEIDFNQADVKATIPTNIIRLEFSNYSQVELQSHRRGDTKMYDFEYWGEDYSWRRSTFEDEGEKVFTFELVNIATAKCIAHITPDVLSRQQSRHEVSQGTWVPPSSMRLTDKNISCDLGDVIVATGLMVLTDECIRRHWREPHRH